MLYVDTNIQMFNNFEVGCGDVYDINNYIIVPTAYYNIVFLNRCKVRRLVNVIR